MYFIMGEFFCNETGLFAGRGLKGIQVSQLFSKVDEFASGFVELFNRKGVAGLEDDLVLLERLEKLVSGFEDSLDFDFHS